METYVVLRRGGWQRPTRSVPPLRARPRRVTRCLTTSHGSAATSWARRTGRSAPCACTRPRARRRSASMPRERSCRWTRSCPSRPWSSSVPIRRRPRRGERLPEERGLAAVGAHDDLGLSASSFPSNKGDDVKRGSRRIRWFGAALVAVVGLVFAGLAAADSGNATGTRQEGTSRTRATRPTRRRSGSATSPSST